MNTCECADGLCPVQHGARYGHPSPRCNAPATTTLYRIDMEDRTGTRMCPACAEDAMSSGLFRRELLTGEDENDAEDFTDLRGEEN